MERENSLVPVNNLISKIDKNLKLVDKFLNTAELEKWWHNLEYNWKYIISVEIRIERDILYLGNYNEIKDYFELQSEDEIEKKIKNYDKVVTDFVENFENISLNSLYHITNKLKNLSIYTKYNVLNLEPIKKMNYLEHLFINNPGINDIQSVYHLKSLKKLRIINSSIPEEQILKLKEINPNCEIVVIRHY